MSAAPESPPFDLSITDGLLSTTRAVRKRLDLDRPVPPQVILDCIRLAVQAPTGSNSQGWRWLVITDPDKRARLADLYRAGGEPYMAAAERDSAGAAENADKPNAGEQRARVRDSSRFLLDNIQRVPVLVIPCIQGRVTDPQWAAGFYGSIYPAVWSFQLALRARGLGSVLTTFHLRYEQEAADLLGIPADITQAGLLPVAYTLGTDFKPARRGPVEEITYWNSWADTTPA